MCLHPNLKQTFTTCSAPFIFLACDISIFITVKWVHFGVTFGRNQTSTLSIIMPLNFVDTWRLNLPTRCLWILVPSCECFILSPILHISLANEYQYAPSGKTAQPKKNETPVTCAKLTLVQNYSCRIKCTSDKMMHFHSLTTEGRQKHTHTKFHQSSILIFF